MSRLISFSSLPLIVLDAKKRIVEVNNALERWLDLSSSELLNTSLSNWAKESSVKPLHQFLEDLESVNDPSSFRSTPNGLPIYWAVKNGEMFGMSSTISFKTKRNTSVTTHIYARYDFLEKQYFLEFHKSKVTPKDNLYVDGELQELSDFGYWYYYPDEDRVVGSDFGYQITGLSAKQKIGQKELLQTIDPHFIKETKQALIDLYKFEEPIDINVKTAERNGMQSWIRVVALKTVDENTGKLLLKGTVQRTDVMQTIKNELFQTEERAQLLIKHVPAAVAITDENLCYKAVSDKWISDYGLEEGKSYVGLHHYDVFPDIPQEWKESQYNILKTKKPLLNQDNRWVRDSGKVLYISGEIRPWFKNDGSVGGLIFFTRLVNDEKEQRRQKQQLIDNLSQSNADLEKFVHVTSHDLKEPLRMIRAYADLLLDSISKEEGTREHRYAKQIKNATQRMESHISSLLHYNLLNLSDFKPKKVNPKEILDSVLLDLNDLIEQKNGTVNYSNLPESLTFDPFNLHVIFSNLISNGLKYNDSENPSVEITCQEKDSVFQFSISDNGQGINTESEASVYDLFQRQPEHLDIEGSGVGLSIVKRLVERHGGSIWFESEMKKGTTFFFTVTQNVSLQAELTNYAS